MVTGLFLRMDFYYALGLMFALWGAGRWAKKEGIEANKMVDLGITIIIGAIIGAKLALIMVDWKLYFSSFEVWKGLLRAAGVFQGGVVGGVIAAWWSIKKQKLPFSPTADIAISFVPLGQAIGRIGCLMAGCCHGGSCSKPWAITYANEFAHQFSGVPLNMPLHPWPIYSFLANLALFGLLVYWYPRRTYAGNQIVVYLLGYSAIRFGLEYFRGDVIRGGFGGLSTGQWYAVVFSFIALVGWRYF